MSVPDTAGSREILQAHLDRLLRLPAPPSGRSELRRYRAQVRQLQLALEWYDRGTDRWPSVRRRVIALGGALWFGSALVVLGGHHSVMGCLVRILIAGVLTLGGAYGLGRIGFRGSESKLRQLLSEHSPT